MSNCYGFAAAGECRFCSDTTTIHSRIMPTSVIITYDTLLTFSREVECIWKRRWSATTILFLINRYSAIGQNICNLLYTFSLPLVCLPTSDDDISLKFLPTQRSANNCYAHLSCPQSRFRSCKAIYMVASTCEMLGLLSAASPSLSIECSSVSVRNFNYRQCLLPCASGRSLSVAGRYFLSSSCQACSSRALTS